MLIQIGGAYIDRRTHNQKQAKQVVQIDNGKIINTFYSIYSAERETKIGHIYEAVQGKRKTAGGYEWKEVKGEDIWKIK